MVQVDVFWSYAIGSGVALASARQIRDASKLGLIKSFDTKAFRNTLLFLALLFAPSGLYLLSAFPHWETMHVARTFEDLPPLLVTAFGLTNITQGILGFFVAAWLIRSGRMYAAYLQWVLGYFCMFFILVHGWDGTGYMRFFSARPELLDSWTWATAADWVTSDVGIALLVMGIFFIPALLYLMSVPVKAGYELDEDVDPARAGRVRAAWLAASVLFLNVVVMPATAIVASLCVRYLGWVGGTVVFALVATALCMPRSLFHRHFRHLMYAESPFGPAREPKTSLSRA